MSEDPTLQEIAGRYAHLRLEREDGILQVTLHSDGEDIVWDRQTHEEVGDCLGEVARDPANRIVILTGAGEAFIDRHRLGGDGMDPHDWERLQTAGRRLLVNHLAVPVPMIAAINGPATIHAELALLCDVVVAADTTVLADRPHFTNGLVPGDGAHVVWPLLLGPNRGRAFLLTGQRIDADEAHALGLVAEVVEPERVVARAWELARTILEQPPLTTRFTRTLLVRQIKRALDDDLDLGLALEGLGSTAWWPEHFR